MDIKELLSNIDNSVLTEESKTQICDVFEEVVSEQVEAQIDERISLQIETSLKEQDEAHTSQLTKLLEAIDVDHSEKLQKILNRVDEEYSVKLQTVVDKYENLLTKEAKALTESLQVDISNFLDLSLEDLLPKDMLNEAVKNTKAVDKLAKIQELVSVDEKFIDSHVREALEDGREQIEALRKDLNGVLKENVKLGAEKSKLGSKLILEQRTHSLPTEKRLFVEETFKGKSASYIENNFDYAIKMFERRENDYIKTEKAQIIEESVSTAVDAPAEKKESNADSDNPHMSEYVSGLK